MYKDVFFRIYANLPIGVRKDIILDLKDNGGPISWEVAYKEINADTELGKVILEKLVELKIIPTQQDGK